MLDGRRGVQQPGPAAALPPGLGRPSGARRCGRGGRSCRRGRRSGSCPARPRRAADRPRRGPPPSWSARPPSGSPRTWCSCDAEHGHGRGRLPAAHAAEPCRRPGRRVVRAVLAGGGRHAHDPLTAVAGGGHDRRRPGRSRRRGGPRSTGSSRARRRRCAERAARAPVPRDGRAPGVSVSDRSGPHGGHDRRDRSHGAPTGSRARVSGWQGDGSGRSQARRHDHDAMTTRDPDHPRPRTADELPTEMLERFRSRAGELDRTNAYFEEDLAELRVRRLPGRRRARATTAGGASTWPRWPPASVAWPATRRRRRWR